MSSNNDLRNRGGASKDEPTASGQQTKSKSKESSSGNAITVVDVLRILGGLFLLNCLLSYFVTNDSVLWGWRPWFIRPGQVMSYFVSLQYLPYTQPTDTDNHIHSKDPSP